MRIPLGWLKEYVVLAESAEEVARRLTMGGLEVEGVEPQQQVRERVQRDFEVSPEAAGLAAALGPVLDVYITPNRGDCTSVVGVAREVAALYDLPLLLPPPPASPKGGEAAARTSVTIEAPDLCPRYAARIVDGLTVRPSPAWLQARLAAAGQRPINNVVDVTNYVLFELGQPLHAFDFDRLAGHRIVVRTAHSGERLRTLDGQERSLSAADLIIADADKAAAVAGVMGGADSEVSNGTRSILLESAHFSPLAVRRTARSLGLRTEASYRFERFVDPNGVLRAVDRACEILQRCGQPAAVPGVVDCYPEPILPVVLRLRPQRAAGLLGLEVSPETAADCLTRLGLAVGMSHDGLLVEVPTFRSDVTEEEDLIEEIGRVYGYENIPERLPAGVTTVGGDSDEGRFLMSMRRALVECGLREVMTHSLTAPGFFDSADDLARRVPVRNALSAELSGLRASLVPTLLDVARTNATRGRTSLAIFEVGRVWRKEANERGEPVETISVAGVLAGSATPPGWQPDARAKPADFYTASGVVDRLLGRLDIADRRVDNAGEAAAPMAAGRLPAMNDILRNWLHPGRTAAVLTGSDMVGWVAELHPALAARMDFRSRVYVFELGVEALERAAPADVGRYRPISRYPAVSRDLAPRVDRTLPFSAVRGAVQAAGAVALEAWALTDVFEGSPLPEGVKSFTLSFTFRAVDHTLAESEVADGMRRIRERLASDCRATFPTSQPA